MHNLFEAMSGSRKPGSFEGRAKFVASNFWLTIIVMICLLSGSSPARAGGDVADCTEFSLLTALQDGGLVTFSENCNITLSGPIVITNEVTIDASDFDVTLSGGGSSQLFIVESGGSLELLGLTLTEGQATNGGAILINAGGTVTLTDCTLVQNSATGADGTDGADGNPNSGTASSGRSGTAGGGGWGGAIFNFGDATLKGCVFATNTATGGNGGNGGKGGNGGLQGGNGGNGGAGGIALGGAIYSATGATLTLEDCTFEKNQVSGGSGGTAGAAGSGSFSGLGGTGGAGAAGSGAGIYSLGDIGIVNCTFDSNTGKGGTSQTAGMNVNGNGNNGAKGGDSLGGGVFVGGGIQITNCTFFGNKVTGGNGGNGGPGNYNGGNGGAGGNGSGGGFYNTSTSDVVNCTFASCGAIGGTNGTAGTGGFPGSNGSPGRGRGGDVANGGGTLTMYNTLLSTNSGGSNIVNISGSFVDGGHNMSSDASYHFSGGFNIAPKLGPLADNGGTTMTMALLKGSPAIDAGDDAAAPTFDQRDFERPMGAHSDIGAYEFGFTVTGQVFSGTNGISGIKISTGNSFVFTDNTGTYQIGANGPVTITPVSTNYTFEPSSTNINVVADVDGVDFEATARLSINGRILGATGTVSVALSSASSTNIITTTNGTYGFGNLGAGTYTVTPSATGVQFSPSSITLTLSSSTNELNFFALFQISGRVFDGSNGLAGVTVKADTNSVITDANGNYTLTNVRAGEYFMEASLTGYAFNNPRDVIVGPSATNVNFNTVTPTYTVSGRVTFGTNGLPGVLMAGTSRSTDAQGFYSITFNKGTQTVRPQLRPYSFLPSSITLDVTNNLTNVNFIAGGVVSSIVVSNDGVHLGVFGPSGPIRIEASTNLINWVTIVSTNGSFGFIDRAATNYPQRFYRTAQP